MFMTYLLLLVCVLPCFAAEGGVLLPMQLFLLAIVALACCAWCDLIPDADVTPELAMLVLLMIDFGCLYELHPEEVITHYRQLIVESRDDLWEFYGA
jgi:hypothetical protein